MCEGAITETERCKRQVQDFNFFSNYFFFSFSDFYM